MIQHILVAIDGSDTSRKAARFGHDLAQQTRARVTLLFVLEPPRVLPFGFMDAELISGAARSPEELAAVRRLLDEVAADLPSAQVAVQISGSFGSRQEEAQRLGRLLRPKSDGKTARFYTIVSRDTVDADFAQNRQRFLAEQGYAYRIVDAGDL